MRIAVGSDHAGFLLKEHVKGFVIGLGHQILDVGTDSEEPVARPPAGAGGGHRTRRAVTGARRQARPTNASEVRPT